MGRKKLALEENVIQDVVSKLEAAKTYTTRSELFNEVVNELVNHYGFSTFSGSVIGQRINQWPNFVLKTPKGKRGLHLKEGNIKALKEWRETGESKKKKVGKCDDLINYFTKEAGGKYLKLAKSVKRGSLKAAVKLNCLYCANFQKKEITHCQCTTCPMHPLRPFQSGSDNTEENLDK